MSDERTPSPVLDEREAAPYIGYTTAALRLWRREGRGPAYIRAGRSIRYTTRDLDSWLMRHRVETREAR
jgi:predicted DNA-binding transcriptional regulator AlpA